jgi:2-polyprenyl-3-methyl-5-hydroxy-6-metoxy-1,4-benzoquinol methylase
MNAQIAINPVATQTDLVRQVLAEIDTIPEAPLQGRYLSLLEADAIVSRTIEHVQRTGSAREYVYLNGHRKRLAASLAMIPMAESETASCVDIGCYGYTAFWAWRHLGYSRVEGIEMCPGEPAIIERTVEMDGERLALRVHNFDISQPEWPLEGSFDTLLFFETLEHVAHDPSGVMLNVTRRMAPESTLVMSVPNAVSYKTLQEFMTGAPPWTYWFFHPDLSHEPRHSFEYTPIFFKILLRCAGLSENAFRTIAAYADQCTVDEYAEIGRALSVESRLFGETMIVQARKSAEKPLFRYPDCIYDGDRYYRSTYPLLREHLDKARGNFMATVLGRGSERQEAERKINKLEDELRQAIAAQREALFLCDTYRAKAEAAVAEQQRLAGEADCRVDQAVAERQDAERKIIKLEDELRQAIAAQREALFLCDAYQAKAEAAVAEQQRLAGEADCRVEQAVAERARAAEDRSSARVREITAVMRETAFLCETYRARMEEMSERAARAQADYECIVHSTFWRLSGPLRRALAPFPGFRARLRRLGRPAWRAGRRLARLGS